MNSMPPQLWIIAGPNGAGKSTFADRFLRSRISVINPDNIALEFREDLPAQKRIAAGREALRRRSEFMATGRSFAVETTLSGSGEFRLMQDARVAGYRITLVFIGVKSATVSQWRVAHRVRMGLHDVPLHDIVRRFDRSMEHLGGAMRIAHRSFVADNTERRLRLLLRREQDQTRVLVQPLPAWVLQAVPLDLR